MTHPKLPENVICEANVVLPELLNAQFGNPVKFDQNFYMQETPAELKLGNHVQFMPYCFVQGIGRMHIADNVLFYPRTYISIGPEDGLIQIGSNTHFAPGCVLYGHGELIIGEHCNIAAHTVFATVEHDPLRRGVPMSATKRKGRITLEKDVWIGANSVITRNTRIAEGCVIGAGAVVTRDTEPYGIYVGTPAKRIKDREPGEPIENDQTST